MLQCYTRIFKSRFAIDPLQQRKKQLQHAVKTMSIQTDLLKARNALSSCQRNKHMWQTVQLVQNPLRSEMRSFFICEDLRGSLCLQHICDLFFVCCCVLRRSKKCASATSASACVYTVYAMHSCRKKILTYKKLPKTCFLCMKIIRR